MAYLDPEGIRYYLPAYMLNCVNNYNLSESSGMLFIIFYPKHDDMWDYKMLLYSGLNQLQKKAVAKFLLVLPELVELSVGDRTICNKALRNYWNQFLT